MYKRRSINYYLENKIEREIRLQLDRQLEHKIRNYDFGGVIKRITEGSYRNNVSNFSRQYVKQWMGSSGFMQAGITNSQFTDTMAYEIQKSIIQNL